MLTGALAIAMRLPPALDVADRVRGMVRGLGLDHDRILRTTLVLVATMVSVSKALVGTVKLLGLLA